MDIDTFKRSSRYSIDLAFDQVTFSARLHLYLAFGFTWSRNQFKENFRHRKNYLV